MQSLKKLSITPATYALVMLALATAAPFATAAPTAIKNIVLVHGAFADATSWSKVIPLLEAKGYHVVAVQNPLTSLTEDVAATKRAIALQDGPVLLVAHSWGGVVITQAGDLPKVRGLAQDIAPCLSTADQRLFLAVQGQSYGPMFDEKISVAAWKTKPSWVLISAGDRMLPPAMEAAEVKSLNAVATLTLPTCHMSILAKANQVAAFIDAAAKTQP
jgi:pimeloyl-ACP methyl ester carboxylesterase